MATLPWAIPTGKAITGSTYIKDTDNNIAATLEDLADWCNNANGAYNDWTLTGLRTDFVDKSTTQTITGAKTFSTAITASGGVTGNLTGTASSATTLTGLTSTVAELNKLDGYTGGVTELNWMDTLHATGVTAIEFDKLDGLTATTAELNILDGVTATTADINKTTTIDSGTYTPSFTSLSNITSIQCLYPHYIRIGDRVTVSGFISIQTSTTTQATFEMSLPIASNLLSQGELGGMLVSDRTSNNNAGHINGVPTNDTAKIYMENPATSFAISFGFSFSYVIQ